MQFMPVVEHVKYPLNGAGKPDKKKRPFIVDPKADGAMIAPQVWANVQVPGISPTQVARVASKLVTNMRPTSFLTQ
jgi:hypothetical protein